VCGVVKMIEVEIKDKEIAAKRGVKKDRIV
jgi:hypothetical protein